MLTLRGNADNRTSSLPAGSIDTRPNEIPRQPGGAVRYETAEMKQAAAERSGADLPSAPLLCFVSYLEFNPADFLDFESPAFFPMIWTL